MGAYLAVTLIVTIAMAAMSTGLNINSLSISSMNQSLRSKIQNLISVINTQIKNGRLNINKIISILQSRNQSALMNYLQNNPIISRNLKELQGTSDLIAEVSAKQSTLESELNSLYSELQSLGYSQSQHGVKSERDQFKNIQDRINRTTKEYQQLGEEASKINVDSTTTVKPYTADIDARTQNITGGMK